MLPDDLHRTAAVANNITTPHTLTKNVDTMKRSVNLTNRESPSDNVNDKDDQKPVNDTTADDISFKLTTSNNPEAGRSSSSLSKNTEQGLISDKNNNNDVCNDKIDNFKGGDNSIAEESNATPSEEDIDQEIKATFFNGASKTEDGDDDGNQKNQQQQQKQQHDERRGDDEKMKPDSLPLPSSSKPSTKHGTTNNKNGDDDNGNDDDGSDFSLSGVLKDTASWGDDDEEKEEITMMDDHDEENTAVFDEKKTVEASSSGSDGTGMKGIPVVSQSPMPSSSSAKESSIDTNVDTASIGRMTYPESETSAGVGNMKKANNTTSVMKNGDAAVHQPDSDVMRQVRILQERYQRNHELSKRLTKEENLEKLRELINQSQYKKNYIQESVIDLLDDDDDVEVVSSTPSSTIASGSTANPMHNNNDHKQFAMGELMQQHLQRRQQPNPNFPHQHVTPHYTPSAVASYDPNNWMNNNMYQSPPNPMFHSAGGAYHAPPPTGPSFANSYHQQHAAGYPPPILPQSQQQYQHHAQFLPIPSYFTPTWNDIVPPTFNLHTSSPKAAITNPPHLLHGMNVFKRYKLTLLSVTEFTITPLASWNGATPSLGPLRSSIKKIASQSGSKAVFEADLNAVAAGEEASKGRWRIPLASYQAFYTFLCSDVMNEVEGIPDSQLKIASMGKALKEKEYPSIKRLVEYGVPHSLSSALAPYQRGGVDFVVGRKGRALIADEMGLGKTVQAIAAMTVYEKEWPLLVLTPSSARYHWEAEFWNWLGRDSVGGGGGREKEDENIMYDSSSESSSCSSNSDASDDDCAKANYSLQKKKRRNPTKTPPPSKTMRPLLKSDIYVVSSSNGRWPSYTRILICPYSIATSLITRKRVTSSDFKCVIADESHMLKNPKSKRTIAILPLLASAERCILLSGTPALARPMELYSQLKCINGLWEDDDAFIAKYGTGGRSNGSGYYAGSSAAEEGENSGIFSELHTMLTSTVMIRRMKADILKSLPRKVRKRVFVEIMNERLMKEIGGLMDELRDSKGVLGKIYNGMLETRAMETTVAAADEIMKEIEYKDEKEVVMIDDSDEEKKGETSSKNSKKNGDIPDEEYIPDNLIMGDNEKTKGDKRKVVINKLFRLTSFAKVPAIVEKLNAWIDDRTKGKICIFAHHVAILDAIQQRAKLRLFHGYSDSGSGRKKTKGDYGGNDGAPSRACIRIDGSTLPKDRQRMITAFQTNPKVRVAVLGITAAGVAVTLTASSTVWFAELFWTPALLVQAEDRCHRIGQQAKVRIKYFIAKNTLDEVLWLLVEKKFKDLGEFVEGKVTNIKIHKEGAVEDQSSDEDEDDDDDRKKGGDDNGDSSSTADHAKGGIPSDITSSNNGIKPELPLSSNNKNGKKKASDVICLSDDETSSDQINNNTPNIPFEASRPNMKFYRLYFPGPTYGLSLLPYKGRIIVHERTGKDPQQHNNTDDEPNPRVGDILISINDREVPFGMRFDDVLSKLKDEMTIRPPVHLIFAHDEDFIQYFCENIRPKVKSALSSSSSNDNDAAMRRRKKKRRMIPPPTEVNQDDVIDLLDD